MAWTITSDGYRQLDRDGLEALQGLQRTPAAPR